MNNKGLCVLCKKKLEIGAKEVRLFNGIKFFHNNLCLDCDDKESQRTKLKNLFNESSKIYFESEIDYIKRTTEI